MATAPIFNNNNNNVNYGANQDLTLNSNVIYQTLANMIISQQVFADNIAGLSDSLVNRARVDGGLYGDTKLYYSTDCLASSEWGADDEAESLLQLYRAKDPKVQKISLDTFRQIRLTVDHYLTKQAWSTPEAFGSFNSVMTGWIRDTKNIYDATIYSAFIGNVESTVGKQTLNIPAITPEAGESQEAKNRLKAQTIAEYVANVLDTLGDITDEYNDYGHLRSYNVDDLVIVWNSEIVNEITKLDMPTIFHKDGLIEKFNKDKLLSKYFGMPLPGEGVGRSDGTVRSLIEQVLISSDLDDKHVFAGQAIPEGYTAPAGTAYVVDNSIVCKIFHKSSCPYMSAFETQTSFVNPKSLTETMFLTFGHNSLTYLRNYPMITIRYANANPDELIGG